MLWRFFWLGLFSVLLIWLYHALNSLGLNKQVFNHRPGLCRHLKGIEYGSEDVILVESKGLVFISSGVMHMMKRAPDIKGKIFLYDFNQPENDPIDLPVVGMDRKDFYPHGMSHWLIGDKIRLFVISHTHPEFKHSVEIFDYDEKKKQLVHVKSVKDANPNDILALSEDQFILTNSGVAQSPFLDMLEVLSFYRGGSLTYFDGSKGHFLLQGLLSPNGIALDKDRKHLIVSFAFESTLRVYDISSDYHTLREISKINLSTMLDNLFVDNDHVIWVGAHPIGYQVVSHLSDIDNPKTYAPSQVLRIEYSSDWKSADVSEVLADDGQFLSGSSAAVHWKGKLVVGTVGRKAAVCEIRAF